MNTGNPVGRTASENLLLARQLGISKRQVTRLGGAARLRGLSQDALAILLAPHAPCDRQTLHRGGLAARGMPYRTLGRELREFLIPPQIDMGDIDLILPDGGE